MDDSDTSTLADLRQPRRTRCKALRGCFDGHDHDDGHKHADDDAHEPQAPCIVPCGARTCGSSDDDIPEPLFVRYNNSSSDIERGDPVYEHVKLSVSGMTCSGCERKLQRALQKIPSIQDIQTDLILAQAQFCIDISVTSVEEALAGLQRMTAYSFERVSEAKAGEQFLDILVDDADAIFQRRAPDGVRGLEQLPKRDKSGKTVVRIYYNPKVVYPRALLEKGFLLHDVELAPIPPPPSVTAGKKQVRRELIYLSIATIFTIPVLVFAWAPVPLRDFTKEAICLFLATAVQVGAAWEFYPSAFKSLFHSGLADMDLLIVLSTSAAYAFSVVSFAFHGTGHPLADSSFFETSTLLVTLIRLGRFVSELARQKATESVSIRTLQAPTALLLARNRVEARETDVRLMQHGDVFRVPPHTRVPTDGIVVYGGSQVDESMMTGESKPVAKGIGSKVTAGTVNLDGTLNVSLSRMAWENSISQIGTLVDTAELSKPRVQALADRVASYFVPAIVLLSLTVFVVWMLIGIYVYKKDKGTAAVTALSYAIATLIISCPCAIGLAVPMVIVIASGVAAKFGVIFRAPSAIETIKNAAHIVFDKTGTLTEGKMTVVDEVYMLKPSISTWPHILGLVSGQRHPVAVAVEQYLHARGLRHRTQFDSVTVIVGGGIEGQLAREDLLVRAGNCDWLGMASSPEVLDFVHRLEESSTHASRNPSQGHYRQHPDASGSSSLDCTVFGVTLNGSLAALFALRDTLRPEAAAVVAALHARSIAVSLVSGDDFRAVRQCAAQLGIPLANTLSRSSPAGKAAYVAMLQSQGPRRRSQQHYNNHGDELDHSHNHHHHDTVKPAAAGTDEPRRFRCCCYRRRRPPSQRPVVFVGDGTNDAVALAQAGVGVSIGSGTDVAKSAADVVLARPDLRALLVAMDVSARAVRRVRFNFLWAACYNVFAVLLAAGAFVGVGKRTSNDNNNSADGVGASGGGGGGDGGVRIPPEFAGLGEVASVLPVVLIAFSLRFARFGRAGGGGGGS